MLRTLLELVGYRVEVASDVTGARAAILERPPHLILVDARLSVERGLRLCAPFHEIGTLARIIALGGSAVETGADDQVPRPFDNQTLLSCLHGQARAFAVAETPRPVGSLSAPGLKMAPAGLRFHTLGDFRVTSADAAAPIPWNRRRPREIFKLLLMNYERVVPSDTILKTFWPDHVTSKARINLHVCMQRLREAVRPVGAGRIQTTDTGYRFSLQADDWLDLRQLHDLGHHVAEAIAAPSVDETLPDDLNRLLGLYGGDLYADEGEAPWVVRERLRMRQVVVRLVGRGASRLLESARPQEACALLRRLVQVAPAEREPALDLAEGLLNLGDRSGAQEVLDGVEPLLSRDATAASRERWLTLVRRSD